MRKSSVAIPVGHNNRSLATHVTAEATDSQRSSFDAWVLTHARFAELFSGAAQCRGMPGTWGVLRVTMVTLAVLSASCSADGNSGGRDGVGGAAGATDARADGAGGSCGDGVVDPGETCDGDCPASCSD